MRDDLAPPPILLRRDGITINRQKTQRLYREEGLTVSRITSGDQLKRRNDDGGKARDLRGMSDPYQPPAAPATLV